MSRFRSRHFPLALLIFVTLATMVFFDRPLIRGDGVAYLAWVDSVALDHDLDLSNQYSKFAGIKDYAVILNWHNGKYVNAFPFGVAIPHFLFYRLGHTFVDHHWLNLNPDYFLAMQGVQLPYSFWIMVGANLLTVGAIVLAWRVARRHCDPWLAALTVWAVFVGTPLLCYSTVNPLNSHNPGAFFGACFLYLAFRSTQFLVVPDARPERETSPLVWIGLGLSAGLMTLCRWQLLLVALPVWGVLLWQRRWRALLWATPSAVLASLPLPLAWNYLFGSPIVVPYDVIAGQDFLHFPVNAGRVLVSTFHHSPILLLCLPGVYRAWQRNRAWAVAIVVIFALQVLINGSTLDWWGGESYGMRRMSDLYFLYGVLIALGLGFMPEKGRASRFVAASLRFLLVALLVYSAIYFLAYLDYYWTSQAAQAFPSPGQVLSHFAQQPDRWRTTAAVLRAHVGPLAWPQPGP